MKILGSQVKKNEEKARLNLFVEKIHRRYQKFVRNQRPHKIHQIIPFFNLELHQRSYEDKNVTAGVTSHENEVHKSYHQWSKHLIAFSKEQSLKKNKLKEFEHLIEFIKYKQQELIPQKQKPVFSYQKYRKTIHISEKCLKQQIKQKPNEPLTELITLTPSRKSSNQINYKHAPCIQKKKKKIYLDEEMPGNIRFNDQSKKYLSYLPKEFKNLELSNSMSNQIKGNKFTSIKQSYEKVEPWLHTADDTKLDTF